MSNHQRVARDQLANRRLHLSDPVFSTDPSQLYRAGFGRPQVSADFRPLRTEVPMRRVFTTWFATVLLTSVLRAQEPVPAPPPAPQPIASDGQVPSLPLILPDPAKRAPAAAATKKVEESPDFHSADEVDVVPVFDSVQAWYYPKGKLGRNAKIVFLAIIDTVGRIEPGSIRVVSATDTSFIVAARLTLMVAYYHPGLIHGHPVRVLVKSALTYDRNTPHACEMNPVTTVTTMLPPKCSPHR